MHTARERSIAFLLILGCWNKPLMAAREPGSHAGQPFHIQAHRGAGIDYPENTLEAFTRSWNMQVTPEADLRTTTDGVIVCFHDKDLSRVVSHLDASQKKKAFADLALADVQQLEVGAFRDAEYAGQHVPLLKDVFAAMRGQPERLLYLDIKGVDLDQLAALIRQYDVASQVIFTTKHHALIREWKKRVPESLTLLWNGGSEKNLSSV